MITTHNRLSELQRTAGVLANLSPQPGEILVTADGCNDGTVDWVRQNMPDVKLIVNNPGKGSIPSRDRMIRETTCEYVLSLDDDSYPVEPDALRKLAEWMEQHPDVGVATFPLETEEYPESLHATSFKEDGYSATFPNCAACFSKAIYEQLPGFPVKFFHIYEEPDFGLQCISKGFAVYHTNVIVIRHHWTSLGRNELKIHQGHSRNEFWSTLMRAPLLMLPLIVCYRIFSQLQYAAKRGINWVVREPAWWWQAFLGIGYCLRNRNPVSWKRYKAWLSLLRNPTTDDAVWKQLLESGSRKS